VSIDLELKALSVAEKVQLLESVWDSLCEKTGDVRSPEWHRAVLEERKRRLESGEAKIVSWNEAKTRLLQLGQ
jgi:putative addiction module component (TIGR02574 family)